MAFTFGSGITIETGITIESGPLPPQPPTLASVTPPKGVAAGNTTVSLVGNNFVGATSVTFGGIPALSYTVANATALSARTPAGTANTSVDVRITNSAGFNAPNTAFAYYPLSPNTAPSIGTTAAAANEQWANFGTAQSGITTSTQPQIQPVYSSVNPALILGYPTAWQLCYAWTPVIINLFSSYSGFNTWGAWSTSGTSIYALRNNTNLTPPNYVNYPSTSGLGAGGSGGNYSAGGFAITNFASTGTDISSPQYFLLGIPAPYVTFQNMAQNKTFTKNGTPWFTATNTCYYPTVSSQAELQVTPGQLGGVSPNYTTLENTTIVQSFKPYY